MAKLEHILAELEKKESPLEAKQLKCYLSDFEKSRISMLQLVDTVIKNNPLIVGNNGETFFRNEEIVIDTLMEKWTTERIDDYIVISTTEIPVSIYSNTSYSEISFLKSYIKSAILRSIESIDDSPKIDKAFVWFKCYLPLKNYDIDNRFFKFYIDGLVHSKIIKSDGIDHFKFGFSPYYDKNHCRLEIYIFDDKNIDFNVILD